MSNNESNTGFCPLCRKIDYELEFHHWDYETDRGVKICRRCHTFIHDEKTAYEQRQDVLKGSSLNGWLSAAIMNLILRDMFFNSKNVKEYNKRRDYAAYLGERYNLSPEIVFEVVEWLASGTELFKWQKCVLESPETVRLEQPPEQ